MGVSVCLGGLHVSGLKTVPVCNSQTVFFVASQLEQPYVNTAHDECEHTYTYPPGEIHCTCVLYVFYRTSDEVWMVQFC